MSEQPDHAFVASEYDDSEFIDMKEPSARPRHHLARVTTVAGGACGTPPLDCGPLNQR
ncbi:hypothetical protein ACFYXJ_07885 [Streptomyces sp. NPDC002667]|uniref:hypothetical protein n=1 Tax=Streptomyces sp. NPDC002667 TaxID=3364657 RepID=UPI003681C2CD